MPDLSEGHARLDLLADIEKSVRHHEHLLDEIGEMLSGKKPEAALP